MKNLLSSSKNDVNTLTTSTRIIGCLPSVSKPRWFFATETGVNICYLSEAVKMVSTVYRKSLHFLWMRARTTRILSNIGGIGHQCSTVKTDWCGFLKRIRKNSQKCGSVGSLFNVFSLRCFGPAPSLDPKVSDMSKQQDYIMMVLITVIYLFLLRCIRTVFIRS